MKDDDTGRETLPAELLDALRSGDELPPMITARIDREIIELASAQFAPRRRPGWRRHAGWAAVAASLLVTALFLSLRTPLDEPAPPVFADIDGSGRLDITDVYLLARRQAATQAEIDAIAMRIVSLTHDGDAS